MVVYPNCKINIGLNIVKKRTDGLHEIETVMYPIPFYDILKVEESTTVALEITDRVIPCEMNDNTCFKAYDLLKKDFDLPPVNIILSKKVPFGAGLGGGSSDGAFMLKLLNEKFKLGLDNAALINYAKQIGSDCAFFIENGPMFCGDTGSEFMPIKFS